MPDSMIPALPTVASLDGDEWLVVEDDPAGTPVTSKTTVNSLHPNLAAHDTLGLATDAELTTHAGAADPHAGYRLESENHTHASSGLQGGTVAHSATTGRTATDHHTNANDPSAGEKAALPGTSGTPGAGNKFVTDADARNTNARTPSAHAASHGSGGTDPVKLGSAYIQAASMLRPTTSPASGTSQTEEATNKQNQASMDFADGSTTYAEAVAVMPSDYNGGTFTVTFYWRCTAASANVSRFQIEARSYGNDEAIDQAFGTAVALDASYGGTANRLRISGPTGAVTPSGTPAGGELMHFRFARLGAHANDTLTATARMLGALITYTRT